MADRYITLEQTRQRLGVGRTTLYRWVAEGKFPKFIRLGERRIAFSEDEVAAWLASREVAS